MSIKTKNILVVDDEKKIVEVIKSYLENSGFSVTTAHAGNEALDLYEKTQPDLIILDLMLPDISGEDICKKIRKISNVPIIMLTAKVEEENILNGLDIGADDYITKPFSPKQLVARVVALLRRVLDDFRPAADIISFNNELEINTTKHEVKKKDQIMNLTPNEYKLLLTLIKYPAKVFTRDELISIAFGGEYEGYDRTIDAHIKNLRQKIELDPKNPKYVLTVHGVGYRFGGEK